MFFQLVHFIMYVCNLKKDAVKETETINQSLSSWVVFVFAQEVKQRVL